MPRHNIICTSLEIYTKHNDKEPNKGVHNINDGIDNRRMQANKQEQFLHVHRAKYLC